MKEVAIMRRIISVIAVAALMAVMLVAMALPALAASSKAQPKETELNTLAPCYPERGEAHSPVLGIQERCEVYPDHSPGFTG